MTNRLCRASIPNNNPNSMFESFEILTIREYYGELGGTYFDEVKTVTDYLDSANAYDDVFYRIFGVYKNQSPKRYRMIGDFNSIDEASNFLFDLLGQKPEIIFYI